MQLHFVGRNFDLTDSLKTFATQKLQHLSKRFTYISTINVALHVEHTTHVAEAIVHASGTDIHASAKNNDMYRAIEELVTKLTAQLNKHKEKMIDDHQ